MALPVSSSDSSSVEIFRGGNLCKQISRLDAKLTGRIEEVEACLQRQRHILDGRIYELERGLARMQVLQDATAAALGDERMELLSRHVDNLENELKNSRLLGGKLLGHLTQQVARLDSEVVGVQKVHEIPEPFVLDDESMKKRMDALESSLGVAISRLNMSAGATCNSGVAEHPEDLQTVERPRETKKGGRRPHESEVTSEQPQIQKEASTVDEGLARLRCVAAAMRSSHDKGKDAMDRLTNSSRDDTGKFAQMPAKVAAIVASPPLAESPSATNTALAVARDEANALQANSAKHEEQSISRSINTWALSALPASTCDSGVPQPTSNNEACVAPSWLHTANALAASPQRQLLFGGKPWKQERPAKDSPPNCSTRFARVKPPSTSVEGPRVLPRQH